MKSLIDMELLHTQEQVINENITPLTTGTVYTATTQHIKDFEEPLAKCEMGDALMFVSSGRWNSYDLLKQVLNKVGPSTLHMSSWSMTEVPARVLSQLKANGHLTQLYCLLDFRIEKRTPEVWQFIQGFADGVRATDIHAKILVLTNETWRVAIVSSMNFTRNKRKEAGIILFEKTAASELASWIIKEINK